MLFLFSIQGGRNAAYPQRYLSDYSDLIQNPITMAETILCCIQDARKRRIPTAVCKGRGTLKTEKEF